VVLRSGAGGGELRAAGGLKERPDLLAGEVRPQAPQQSRSRQKRIRWKRAGLAVFAEKGYERATIQEIAGRARLPVGGFYLHFGSKRQLLLALMDELLEHLSVLDLKGGLYTGPRAVVHSILKQAFSRDLAYLGACRAWQEAVLSDVELAEKNARIQQWTTARTRVVFEQLQRLRRARKEVDVDGLARVIDAFFWGLLGRAAGMDKKELKRWVEVSAELIYHALFEDGDA